MTIHSITAHRSQLRLLTKNRMEAKIRDPQRSQGGNRSASSAPRGMRGSLSARSALRAQGWDGRGRACREQPKVYVVRVHTCTLRAVGPCPCLQLLHGPLQRESRESPLDPYGRLLPSSLPPSLPSFFKIYLFREGESKSASRGEAEGENSKQTPC